MNSITKEMLDNTNDSELLMLYYENDEDAKNLLFHKYKFIIDILIKKHLKFFNTLNIDLQEVYSECNVGFSDGLKKYVPNKNTSLPTFITLCIDRRLKKIIRKYSTGKYKTIQSAYSLDFIYEDNLKLIDNLEDFEYDPIKNIEEEESYNELIKEIKNELSEYEYEVFLLMIQNINYKEIAKILNKTPKQIDNSIQRIKIKVKKLRIGED